LLLLPQQCALHALLRRRNPLPRGKPEEVGMSSERLALIGKAVDAEIARGLINALTKGCAETAGANWQ